MFSCASGTRARMQRIDFNFNGTMDLSALEISRRNIDTPVLWATEATDLNLTDVDLLWGRVPDFLEEDPNLQTIRSDVFYVPAGGVDLWGVTTGGQPTVLPALAWSTIGSLLSKKNDCRLLGHIQLCPAAQIRAAHSIRSNKWSRTDPEVDVDGYDGK